MKTAKKTYIHIYPQCYSLIEIVFFNYYYNVFVILHVIVLELLKKEN